MSDIKRLEERVDTIEEKFWKGNGQPSFTSQLSKLDVKLARLETKLWCIGGAGTVLVPIIYHMLSKAF